MPNKITKEIRVSDEKMLERKSAKKSKVKELGNKDQLKEGGSWPHQGFGTEPDYSHYVKSDEKSDYRHEEPGEGSMQPGDWPNPVKKPTLKDVGAKAYLGHFAGDEVIKEGHNVSYSHKLGGEAHEKAEVKEYKKMEKSLNKLSSLHKKGK